MKNNLKIGDHIINIEFPEETGIIIDNSSHNYYIVKVTGIKRDFKYWPVIEIGQECTASRDKFKLDLKEVNKTKIKDFLNE